MQNETLGSFLSLSHTHTHISTCEKTKILLVEENTLKIDNSQRT
jgi:hypothetical protein